MEIQSIRIGCLFERGQLSEERGETAGNRLPSCLTCRGVMWQASGQGEHSTVRSGQYGQRHRRQAMRRDSADGKQGLWVRSHGAR